MRTFAATLRGHPSLRLDRAASLALDAGFRKVVLGAPLHDFQREEIDRVLPRQGIAAVEVFLPYPRALRPGTASPFEIAAAHPEARRDSVKQAGETIIFAERRAVPVVILPPARLDGIARSDLLALRRDHLFPERLARLLERRREEARRRVDALLSFLSKLIPAAERYEVRLALVPSGFPDEVPGAEEAEEALRELAGAPLGTWLDAARAAAGLELDPALTPRWERLAAASAGATLEEDAAALPRSILDRPAVWAIDPPGDGFQEALGAGRALLEKLDRGPGTESAARGILGP